MDVEKWLLGEYPAWLMAHILVWYQMKHLIHVHTEDAKSRKMEKDRKKK